MEAINELLFKMADDLLILGHRHSEWTGLGPLLEEDIAFSSMAQDKIGQSLALYTLLHQLGEANPDTLGFHRQASDFRNCWLVEQPNHEYDYSLVRHFLFDTADALRFELLTQSSYQPLAQVAVKIRGELRYHTMHANTWMIQLGNATTESISRVQRCLDEILPLAFGMFEKSPLESVLIKENIFVGEQILQQKWQTKIDEIIQQTKLVLPNWKTITPTFGGRQGEHSPHLSLLLNEMCEVIQIDPSAEW